MKRNLAVFLALAALTTTVGFAQSAKATAAINTAVGCTFTRVSTIGDTIPLTCTDLFTEAAVPVTPDFFVTVMSSSIKVSNSQSLFVSPSLVTGLYTQTKTRTSPGETSTAVAEGGVYMRAIVTNKSTGVVQIGYPVAVCASGVLGCQSVGGKFGVILNNRVQSLTQELSDCVVNVSGAAGTCNFTSTIDLMLKTTSAHSFNFIFPNVGVGTYEVAIQAAVSSGASVTGLGTAVGGAAYGLGSLTVESVRLVHDFTF